MNTDCKVNTAKKTSIGKHADKSRKKKNKPKKPIVIINERRSSANKVLSPICISRVKQFFALSLVSLCSINMLANAGPHETWVKNENLSAIE